MKKKMDNLPAVFILIWIVNFTQGNKMCGDIRHEGPAIRGRYVRFLFTPVSPPSRDQMPQWSITSNYNPRWTDVETTGSPFNKSVGNRGFILDLKTSTWETYIGVYASLVCQTTTYRVDLEELILDKCGKLYLEPATVKPKADITIKFVPHQTILTNPLHFNQTWRVRNETCTGTLGCAISEEQTAFETKHARFYGDLEYILVIKSLGKKKDGTYFLQCDEEKYTEGIDVVTPA